MADFDFSAMFDDFSNGGNSNPIESIYKIIPRYDDYQMKLLMCIRYYAAKWQLEDVNNLLDQIDSVLSDNRNLGFFSSKNLERLLAAYTQNEMIRGIKVNAFNNNDNSGGVR